MKRLFLSLLISIGLILFLLAQISIHDLLTLLKTIDLRWALLGGIGYFFALLLRAIRFKWLIHSKDVSLSDLIRISVFHNVSLMILPSKLGEISYPYLLYKVSGMTFSEGLASLIASRVYDFFTVLIIFIFASIGSQSLFKINLFLVILSVVLLIITTLLLFFYMDRLLRLFSNGLGKITHWAGLKNNKPIQWLQRKIHEVAEDFNAIQAKRTHLPVTLVSLVSWIMAFWMFYALLRGFGTSISFLKVIFASTIAVFTATLPISGVGNWGLLEAGWTAGFLLVGLSKGVAITTGFGVHIAILMISLVIGFFCWIILPPFPLAAKKRAHLDKDKRKSPSRLLKQ